MHWSRAGLWVGMGCFLFAGSPPVPCQPITLWKALGPDNDQLSSTCRPQWPLLPSPAGTSPRRCPPSPMSAPRELPRLAAAPAASTHSPPRGFCSLTCVCISGSRSTQHPSDRLPRAWGRAVGAGVDAASSACTHARDTHTHAHARTRTGPCAHPFLPSLWTLCPRPSDWGRGREGVRACLAAASAPRIGVFVGDGGYEFMQVSPRCCHHGWPCGEAPPQVTKSSLWTGPSSPIAVAPTASGQCREPLGTRP